MTVSGNLTAGKGFDDVSGARTMAEKPATTMPSQASPLVELDAFYTSEDAKAAEAELAAPASWAIVLNVVGAVGLVGVLLSPLSAFFERLNLLLVLALLLVALACFFLAHLVTRFKDLCVYQRELYVIQRRRELRAVKMGDKSDERLSTDSRSEL